MEAFLKKYLGKNQEAYVWVSLFLSYCHAIDDIVDNSEVEIEFIIKSFETALVLYSMPFYINNVTTFYSLIKMVTNTYMDSIKLETEDEQWKKNLAGYLCSTGNEVVLATIDLVSGYDARRQASIELREISYHTHHNELGEKI